MAADGSGHVDERPRIPCLDRRIRTSNRNTTGRKHVMGGVGIAVEVVPGGMKAAGGARRSIDERDDRLIAFRVHVCPRVGEGDVKLVAADAGDIVGVGEFQMRQPVTVEVGTAAGTCGLEGVDRGARTAITTDMDMESEALRVKRADEVVHYLRRLV